jgi:hypothetical protein
MFFKFKSGLCVSMKKSLVFSNEISPINPLKKENEGSTNYEGETIVT